jgi:hypothetical protein
MMNSLTQLHCIYPLCGRIFDIGIHGILGICSNPVFKCLVNMLTDLFIPFIVVAVSYGSGQDQTQNTFTTNLIC